MNYTNGQNHTIRAKILVAISHDSHKTIPIEQFVSTHTHTQQTDTDLINTPREHPAKIQAYLDVKMS